MGLHISFADEIRVSIPRIGDCDAGMDGFHLFGQASIPLQAMRRSILLVPPFLSGILQRGPGAYGKPNGQSGYLLRIFGGQGNWRTGFKVPCLVAAIVHIPAPHSISE